MLGGAFRLLVTLYAPIPSEASNSPVGAPYETRLFFLVTPLGGQFPLGFGGGALNPTFRKSPFGIL